MTADEELSRRDCAEKQRSERDFQSAAQSFTLAAYEYLGDCEYPNGRGLSSGTMLGDAIYCLQSAAIEFHKAGTVERAQNRCRQGILILEDFREHVSEYDAIDGVLTECIADFQLIASIDDPSGTYNTARSIYADVDEPSRWQSEPVFQSTIHFLVELGRHVDMPISESTQVDVMRSFDDRVSLKEQRLPQLLAEIETNI